MLSDELREVLLHGPSKRGELLRYGGAATVRVAWGKHRDELMAACPPGRRPWAFWLLDRRMKYRPAGEAGELRAIRALNIYRDEAERELVDRRLSEINANLFSGKRASLRQERAA